MPSPPASPRMRVARAKGESRLQPACARRPGGGPPPLRPGGPCGSGRSALIWSEPGALPPPRAAAWQPAKVQGPFATSRRGSPASRASRRYRPRHRSLMLGPCRPPPARRRAVGGARARACLRHPQPCCRPSAPPPPPRPPLVSRSPARRGRQGRPRGQSGRGGGLVLAAQADPQVPMTSPPPPLPPPPPPTPPTPPSACPRTSPPPPSSPLELHLGGWLVWDVWLSGRLCVEPSPRHQQCVLSGCVVVRRSSL
jgi:hypothetical protein